MAVETQLPNADGSLVQLTPVNVDNNFQAVDEAVANDDTDYNKTPSGGFATRTDRFDFDWSAIGDTDSITKIVIRFRAKLGASGVEDSDQIRALAFDSGASFLGTLESPVAANYTDFEYEYTLIDYPDNGADLKANWEFGYRCDSNNLGDDDIRVTRLEVEITYTPNTVAEADVVPLTASFTTPAVTASYVQVETGAVSPLAAAFSIPAITANHEVIVSAGVSPLTSTFALPGVTATYKEKTESLVDNFNDNSIDTAKWSSFGSPVETSNRLEMPTATSPGYSGLTSVRNYILTGSYIQAEVIDEGDQNINSYEFYPIQFIVDSDNWVKIYVIGGTLYAAKRVAGTTSTPVTTAYSNSTHRWLRIRENSGTTYWEYSDTGSSWNTLHSESNPIDLSSGQAEISAGVWDTEAQTTTGIVDNFNILVDIAGVSPLTASLTTPVVTASYIQTETASLSPLTVSFTIPAVTAVGHEVVTAAVNPLTASFTIPAVTATTELTAGVAPLTATFTIPSLTAEVPPSVTTVVPPKAVTIKNRKVLVIIESRNPTFRYATEDWDFTEITREINGSSMVRFRTDQLTNDIANAITDLGNRVTVRISTDDTASAGLNYFSGYIPTRQLNLTPEDQSVEIIAFGFASRLFDIPFRSGTTTTIDHSSTGIKASDLVEDVIDNAVALDAQLPLTYSTSTVDDSSDTIKDKFVLQSSAETLNRAVNLAFDSNVIWHWFVDGDSKFYFKKNSTTADHNFVFGRDITAFPIFTEDMQRAVNEVLVVYNGGANIKRVVDQDSIDSVGLRSMTVNETNIPDVTTATEVGNSYLAQRDLPIRSITVTVSDPYFIESINPGDTCRIDNMDADISGLLTQNMFVTRTSYRRETVDLELSLKHPFLANQIELIRRRFEKESTESIAATSYS